LNDYNNTGKEIDFVGKKYKAKQERHKVPMGDILQVKMKMGFD